MRFLLDTTICVLIIRGRDPALLSRFTSYPVAEIGVSAITVAELQFGVERSSRPIGNQQALDRFLLPLTVVDFDHDTAVSYGPIRQQLTSTGTLIGSLDMLIAAHAMSKGLILVTNNTREFTRVPGLVVEDWSRP